MTAVNGDDVTVVIAKDGHRITPCPARVLDVLKACDGVVGTWQLVEAIDARPTTATTATLRSYVRRIRAELGYDCIKCEWGRGYLLTETGRRVLEEREGASNNHPVTRCAA